MKRILKPIIITCAVILAIVLLFNAIVLAYDTHFFSDTGTVTRISVRSRGDDEIVLKLSYNFATGGYSVRNVPESEGEYIGDGMIDYDGSLGKYRIMINFGDIEPSLRLRSRLRVNNTVKSSPVKLKASVAHPSDHGFVLYIGSDTPISVEPVENGELNELGGVLKISIAVGNE